MLDIPPVNAGAVVALPKEACSNLTNAGEIAGNYCITYRGSCSFKAKYDNCVAAGAIRAIVINSQSEIFTMGVSSIDNDFPFLFIGNDDGEALVDLLNTSNGIVQLTSGSGVVTGDYASDPFTAFSWDTLSKVPLDPPPFDYVDHAAYVSNLSLFYVYERSIDTVFVLDVSDVESAGEYYMVGNFSTGDLSLQSMSVVVLGDGEPYLTMSTLDGVPSSNEVVFKVYDIEDPADPKEVAVFDSFGTNPECPSSPINYYFSHKGYLYAVPINFVASCETDLIFEGTSYGPSPVAIFDLVNNGTDPIGYFEVPELEEGNIPSFTYGRGFYEDVALVTMGGGGVVFYDFSDALNPVAISEVDRLLDPSTYSASTSFSVGALNSVFGREAGSAPSDDLPAMFIMAIDDPAAGEIVFKQVIANMSI